MSVVSLGEEAVILSLGTQVRSVENENGENDHGVMLIDRSTARTTEQMEEYTDR